MAEPHVLDINKVAEFIRAARVEIAGSPAKDGGRKYLAGSLDGRWFVITQKGALQRQHYTGALIVEAIEAYNAL